jgi:hypothetical protein
MVRLSERKGLNPIPTNNQNAVINHLSFVKEGPNFPVILN